MPLIADIRDTLSRIRARTTWARFNMGAALTCCAVALGFYFWREIILYILNHL